MVVKTDKYFIVIDSIDKLNSKVISDNDIKSYCDNNDCIVYYAFIKHIDDINELGALEVPHYHLFIKLRDKYSKTTIINDIAKVLMCNKSLISTRKFVQSMSACIRYLVHADNPEKKEYDIKDITTNDWNETLSLMSKGVSSYDLDIDYLIDLVRSSRSLTQVYKTLGMRNTRTYRAIISDLWKERSL